MVMNIRDLGVQLREARRRRGLTQPALASRLGRAAPRISELERGLLTERLGRDRLALLLEACDVLDLVPMLVPRDRAVAVRAMLEPESAAKRGPASPDSVFDEVFVDLGDTEE